MNSQNYTGYINNMLSFLHVVLNPGKYRFNVDKKGPGMKFILESFRLSLDIKKIIAGAIFLILFFFISLFLFPIPILEGISSLSRLSNFIPQTNYTMHRIISQIRGFNPGLWIILLLFLFLALFITLYVTTLVFIGSSTMDGLKEKDRGFREYLRISVRERKIVAKPILYMILTLFIFGILCFLTGYIGNISYLGALFITIGYPVILTIGIIVGLFVAITWAVLMFVAPAHFDEEEKSDDESDKENSTKKNPFEKAVSVMLTNFPQYIKGQLLIFLTCIFFTIIIILIFTNSIGLAHSMINGILMFALRNVPSNLNTPQIPYWTITALSFVISNAFLMSLLLSIPFVFIITANCVLYKNLTYIKDAPIKIIDSESFIRKNRWKVIAFCGTYIALAFVGFLFSISFFDPFHAEYCIDREEYQKSMGIYRKVVSRKPEYAKGYLRIGQCLYNLNKGNPPVNEILVNIERSLELYPPFKEKEPQIKEIFEGCGDKLYQSREYFGRGSYFDAKSVYQLMDKYYPGNKTVKKRLAWIKKIEEDLWVKPFANPEIETFDGPVVNNKPRGVDTDFVRGMKNIGVSFTAGNRLHNVLNRDYNVKILWYRPGYENPSEFSYSFNVPYTQKKIVMNQKIPVGGYVSSGTHRIKLTWKGKTIASSYFIIKDEIGVADSIRLYHYLINEKDYYSAYYYMLGYKWRNIQSQSEFEEGYKKTEYCYVDKVYGVRFKNEDEARAKGILVYKNYGEKEKKVVILYVMEKGYRHWRIEGSRFLKVLK